MGHHSNDEFANPRCEACAFGANALSRCVDDRGATNPEILLVALSPGREEDEVGQGAVGRRLDLLNECLSGADLTWRDVRYTHAVRCRAVDDIGEPLKIKVANIDTCGDEYLIQVIDAIRPKVIMPMGAEVTKWLLRVTDFERRRGRKSVFEYDGGIDGQTGETVTVSIPVVPTHGITKLLRGEPRDVSDVSTDLGYAKKVASGIDAVRREADYRVLTTEDEVTGYVDECFRLWKAAKGDGSFRMAVDCETSSPKGYFTDGPPNPFDLESTIVSIQFSHKKNQGVLIYLDHPDGPWASRLGMGFVRKQLNRLLDSPIPFYGQNLKYDYEFIFTKMGITIRNPAGDTMLMHHALFGGARPNSLEYLESRYLDIAGHKNLVDDEMLRLQDARTEKLRKLRAVNKTRKAAGKAEIDESTVPVARLEDLPAGHDGFVYYSCSDPDHTLTLSLMLEEMLDEAGLRVVYEDLYWKVWKTITEMEVFGTHVDLHSLNEVKHEYGSRIEGYVDTIESSEYWQDARSVLAENALEKKNSTRKNKLGREALEDLAPKLNMNSPVHKQVLLYDILDLPPANTLNGFIKATRSADKKVLAAALSWCEEVGRAEIKPIIQTLLDHSEIATEYKNYICKLDQHVYDQGQEVGSLWDRWMYREPMTFHTSYYQDGTVSGRLSTRDPTLHGIPRKSATKRAVTSRWVTKRNRKSIRGLILAADYSQMEFRVMAAESGDRRLIQAFLDGLDVHKYVASMIWRIPMERVTDEQRQLAKTVGFGIIYGRTAIGIARGGMGVSEEYAQEIIDRFFAEFPDVKRYIDRQHAFAIENEFCKSVLGRIRPLPEINSGRKMDKIHALNAAVNTPIQGAASDVNLNGIYLLRERGKELGLRGRPFGAVHDSCISDVPIEEIFTHLTIVPECMVKENQEHFEWFTVPMEIDVEVGVGWGSAVTTKWDPSKKKVTLSGKSAYVYPVFERVSSYWGSDIKVSEWIEDGDMTKSLEFRVNGDVSHATA